MAENAPKPEVKRWRKSDDTINDRRTAGEQRQEKQAVTEDLRVEHRRSADRRRRVLARVRSAVDYLFFLLYALLALRVVLALVDANEQAGFVQFIRDVTGPFYSPFSDIVEPVRLNGGELNVSALIALFAYALLHAAVRKLLRVFGGPPEATQAHPL